MFTDSPYTKDNTHCTCSSTIAFIILALMYSLQAIMNLDTFYASPLNTSGLATFLCDFSPPLPTPLASNVCICTCIVANCFCYWKMIACKSCWLMLKDRSKDVIMLRERAEPILVLSSDSYSELHEILIDVRGPSSCSSLHYLLTTSLTDY